MFITNFKQPENRVKIGFHSIFKTTTFFHCSSDLVKHFCDWFAKHVRLYIKNYVQTYWLELSHADVKSRVTTIFLNLLRQLLFQEWNFESYIRYYSSIWCLFKSNLAWIGLELSLIRVGFKIDRFRLKSYIRLTYILMHVFLI